MDDFVQREFQRQTVRPGVRTSVPRSRSQEAADYLHQLATAMDGGQVLTDALIHGHLVVQGARTAQSSVPVTYSVTRDGREKIITEVPGANTVTIADGSRTHTMIGPHLVPLSLATMEDHQVLILPQWSLVQHHSDGAYGVKRFDSVSGRTSSR